MIGLQEGTMTLDQIVNKLSVIPQMKTGLRTHIGTCRWCQDHWQLPHFYEIVEMGGPRRYSGPSPAIHAETPDPLLVDRMMEMLREEDLEHRKQTGWPKFVGLSVLGWYDV
jgi:hypothetical protein